MQDHGGLLQGSNRQSKKIDTVELRSMIALDGDRIDKGFLKTMKRMLEYLSSLLNP